MGARDSSRLVPTGTALADRCLPGRDGAPLVHSSPFAPSPHRDHSWLSTRPAIAYADCSAPARFSTRPGARARCPAPCWIHSPLRRPRRATSRRSGRRATWRSRSIARRAGLPFRRAAISMRIARSMSLMIDGWMPSVGSSRMSSRGRIASARAMASCCCWPPDRSPPRRCSMLFSTGNSSKTNSGIRRRRGPAWPAPSADSPRPSDGERSRVPAARSRCPAPRARRAAAR